MNYYVLQVAPREEEKTELHIKKILPADSYEQCFHLTRLLQKKFRGEWTKVQEKLLPGYVFVTTEDASALYQELKRIPLLTKVLGREMESFVRLSGQEEQWLDLLRKQSGEGAGTSNEVGLSQIDIKEGNEIRIISGPLVDMEGMIRRINLHKRIAEVEVPFMNGSTVIHLGVEMVERK